MSQQGGSNRRVIVDVECDGQQGIAAATRCAWDIAERHCGAWLAAESIANPHCAHKPTLNARTSDKILRIARCDLMLDVFSPAHEQVSVTWVTLPGLTAHSKNSLDLLMLQMQNRGRCLFHAAKNYGVMRINLSKPLFFAVFVLAVLTIASPLPQSGTATSQLAPRAPGKISPSAVWQAPHDFITNAHAACDKSNPPNYAECFIDEMSKAGAPADAVSFTRVLYKQSGGEVGIMTDFHKAGPVDEARVLYPLRANDNYGLLLVNGDPAILDVDDLKKLDRATMEQDAMYQAVKQRYPNSDLWPGDRSGNTWLLAKTLPDGGQQFMVSYPLLNGCHACAHTGVARFSWNFDAKGKFLGTKYIPTPPPPKLLRPKRPMQPAPPAQQQPPPQP